ncbi:MAG: Trm112 family protein [Colwellia sp.]|nr:Trm112 family protein [Colwellia sp.]
MAFDIKLMEILACPVCKGKLDYNKAQQELICKFDKLAYAIDKDIPVLLESEARHLSVDDVVPNNKQAD